MGMLVDGKWDAAANKRNDKDGRFVRKDSAFRNRVTADGSSGFKAEAGRYHLYVAYSCPWAHRTLIFRRLKGLDSAISIAVAVPGDRHEGWAFGDYPGAIPDAANGFTHLHQAYTASEPGYTGSVTVPVLWDKKERVIVNNESAEIIRMLNSAFGAVTRDEHDYYPAALRPEIDRVNDLVYRTVNNGVYRCGFAQSQAAYDEAFDALFATLDEMEARLARQRYLVGNRLTEADWRLFCTLIRFDVVYYAHFKCNARTIASYPNLSNYLRELYQVPGVAETVNFPHIVHGYYSIEGLNPTGIIPRGPRGLHERLLAPHDRGRFAGAAA
jgi:glutathionyl-hydroquinone reductase